MVDLFNKAVKLQGSLVYMICIVILMSVFAFGIIIASGFIAKSFGVSLFEVLIYYLLASHVYPYAEKYVDLIRKKLTL